MTGHFYRDLPERGKKYVDFILQCLVVASILSAGAQFIAPKFLASVFADAVREWIADHYEPKINVRFIELKAEIAVVAADTASNKASDVAQWSAIDQRLGDLMTSMRAIEEQNSRILLLLASREQKK